MERVSWNNVITFWDLVQRLRLRRSLNSSPSELARLRTAVDDAYRELPTMHNWKYYHRDFYLRTEASVPVGNATYDHTGGAHERQLTLASGSWPASVEYGYVYYDNFAYQVERRISSTVVTLSEETNPGKDLSFSGALWFRSRYTLPSNIYKVSEVWQANSMYRLVYSPVAVSSRLMQAYRTAGNPIHYSLLPSRDQYGVMELCFIPAPATEIAYKISCKISPTPFRTFEVAGTDASVSASSTTLTSVSANFSDRLVGSLIRVSPTARLPKGLHQHDEQRDDYVFQSIVRRRISATQLELAQPCDFSGSPLGYSISDIADIEPRGMLSYLEALTWEKFSIHTQGDEDDKMDLARSSTIAALRRAIGAEAGASYEFESALYGSAWWPIGSDWPRYTTVLYQ